MKIVKVQSAPPIANPHGVAVQALHKSEHVAVNQVTLQPGEALKTHTTPVDAFFFVLEGEGVVEVDGEQQTVGVDTLVDSPAGHPHRLLNPGTGVFRFLVVKTPGQPKTGS